MNFLKNLSLKVKLLAGFYLSTIVILAAIGMSYYEFTIIENNILKLSSESLVFSQTANKLQLTLLKTQETFTDASLMKEMTGLKEAKRLQEEFKDELSEFYDFYEQDATTDRKEIVEAIEKAYDQFIKSGIEMATAFIMGNIDEGKKLMKKFDKESTEIQEYLEPFVEAQVDAADAQAAGVYSSVKFAKKICIYSIIIGLILVVLVSLFLNLSLNNINKNFKKILLFAKELGQGNLRAVIDIQSKDEVGQIASEFNNASINLQNLLLKISNTGGSLNFISTKLSDISGVLDSKSTELKEKSNMIATSSEEILVTNKNMAEVIGQSTVEIDFAYQQTTEMQKTFGEVIKSFSDTTYELSNLTGVVEMISEILKQFNQTNRENLLTINKSKEKTTSIVENIKNVEHAVTSTEKESNSTLASIEKMVVKVTEVVEQTKKAVIKTNEIIASMQEVEAESKKVADEVKLVQSEANNSFMEVEKLEEGFVTVSKNVNTALEISHKAKTHSENASQIVESLVNSAEEIDQVVEFIEEIASQTSLLALNATIEAARAGEMGKGFAVVANEVKELAKNTTKQTDIIRDKIDGINAAGKKALEAMEGTVGIIGEMNTLSKDISVSVETQVTSSVVLKESMKNVKLKTNEIFESSDQSARLSSKVFSESKIVNDFVKSVGDNVNSFYNDVDLISANSTKVLSAIKVVKGLSEEAHKLGEETLHYSTNLVEVSNDFSEKLNGLTGTAKQTSMGAVKIGQKVGIMDTNIDETNKQTENISTIVKKLNEDSSVNAQNIGDVIKITDTIVKDVVGVSSVSQDASAASKKVLETTGSLRKLVEGMKSNLSFFQLPELTAGTKMLELYSRVEADSDNSWNKVCGELDIEFFVPREFDVYFDRMYSQIQNHVENSTQK